MLTVSSICHPMINTICTINPINAIYNNNTECGSGKKYKQCCGK